MHHFKHALLSATAVSSLFAAPAIAQTSPPSAAPAATQGQAAATPNGSTDAPEKAADIVITGTLIRGVAPVGSAIIAVSHQDMVQTGLGTTEDVLKSIPEITSIGPSSNPGAVTVQNSNLNNTRADAINIRGIGPQATLPLLDGRRVPPGGAGAQLFDASSFPTIALARIDVVADGASATYGSDAVAGVANFILRKNVEGLEVSGRYGTASDTSNYQYSMIAGHQWSTGGIMFAGEVNHESRLAESSRAGYFQCNETALGYANNCLLANGAAQTANIGTPGNLIFKTGSPLAYGLPAGSGVGVTAGQLTAPNIGSNATGQDILPASTRYSFVLSAHVDAGPVTLWTEDYYTRRQTLIHAGYLSFSSSVPNTNPGFVTVPGQSTTSETVQYALVNEYGVVQRPVSEDGSQMAVGADVKLGGDFKGTVYYEHNNNTESYFTAALNGPLLARALSCTAGVCFNPYGSGGSTANIAAASSFVGFQKQTSHYDSNLANGKIDGTVFHIPGGDVKLAVGGEWHWDKILNYNTQNNTAASPTLEQVAVTTNARYSRKVTSAFGELIIPIFGADNARPGFQKLTLDVAGRYDHYSDVGGTSNPKLGITWEPVHDLSLRGSYGTSFRAPTVCDSNPLCTPGVLTNAAAPTALYGLRSPNAVVIVGGNGSLKPETATTWSAGFEFKPHDVPRLVISLNYFNIDYKNVIYTPGNSSSIYVNPIYSQYITANPTQAQVAALTALPFFAGLPTLPGCASLSSTNTAAYQCLGAIVNGTRSNAGAEKMSGLDFSINYRLPVSRGQLSMGVTGTYLLKYDISVVQGAPFLASLNQFSAVDAPLGDPLRFRARGQLGYNINGFYANAFLNYTNSYRIIGLVTPTQNDRVSANATLDLTFGYTFGAESGMLHDLHVGADVFDVTNKMPPIAVVSLTQQYDPGQANIIGRQFAFSMSKKF